MDDTVKDEGRKDPLAGFGIGLEELLDREGPGRRTYADVRDGRVCACGHPMTKHYEVEVHGVGKQVCRPPKTECGCAAPKPVLTVSDVRPFLRKTNGHGSQHALMRGIAGLMAKEGRTLEWLDGWPKCELELWPCGSDCEEADGVLPYTFNARGLARPETDAITLLLCRAHGLAAIENGLPQ